MAMNKIRKFKFWSQKVLPLVYDDSLSYYEVLCKVVQKLNEVIKNIDEIPDYINQYIDERLSDEHIQELIRQAINYLEDAISKDNEGDNTNFSKDYKAGDLLWWNDKFCRVIRDVDAGDSILDSGSNPNVEEISFAEMFIEFIDYLKGLFTVNDEGGNTNASRNFDVGEFVWINDELYEIIEPITQGNSFIYSGENQNVKNINVDSLIHEIREQIALLNEIVGDLDNLTTTDKSNVVAAINELDSTLDGEIENNRPINIKNFGAVGDGVTDDTAAFITALNSEKWLYIPDGTYNINGITITDKTINVKCSPNAVFVNAIGFHQCRGNWIDGNFSNTVIINDCTDFIYENVNISSVTSGACLYVTESDDVKIYSCNFSASATATHDFLIENSSNCVIDKCNATGNPINHNMQLHNCKDCSITNSYCANAQEFGISIWQSNNCIVNSSITTNTIKEGINIQGSSQNKISNCIIRWDSSNISTDFGISLAGLLPSEYANENSISDVMIINCKKCALALAGNCLNNNVGQISILYPNANGGDIGTYNAALLVYPVDGLIPAYNRFADILISPSANTAYIFYEDSGSNYNIFTDFVLFYYHLPIKITGVYSEYANIYNMSPARLTYVPKLLDENGVELTDYTIDHAYYDDECQYVNVEVQFTLTANSSALPTNLTLPTASTLDFGQVTAYSPSTGKPILAVADSTYGVQIRNIDNTPLNAGIYKVMARYQRDVV